LEQRFYSKRVLELFLNPPLAGELVGADGRGETVNPACSDRALFTVKVAAGIVEDVRFRTQGCAAAIAASAATALLAKGKTVEEAEGISVEQVVEYLDGLPESKKGCSVIAPEALRLALAECRKGKGDA